MSSSEDATLHYLASLSRRIGVEPVVLASADGLLIAGTGAPSEALEELAAYAPSQLPAKVERPAGLAVRRVELGDDRLYLAALGVSPPVEAAEDLARILREPADSD